MHDQRLPERLSRRRLVLLALAAVAVLAWASGPPPRLLLALAALLLGPGFLALQALPQLRPRDPLVSLGLALGLGASLVPLLYQWATLLGLSLTTPVLAALAWGSALAAALLAWREPGAARARVEPFVPLVVLLTLLTLVVRFVQIRGLAFPVWVDSPHHALLIRVAAERGQAPLSLEPYLPVAPLTYHWGYHALLAAAAQLAGLELPRELPEAMLWSGQLLSTLAVPAYAAAATRLWGRPTAGAAAGLVVGLLSIMPAYYVSWGRYTLLTGLLLLPAVLIVTRELRRAPRQAALALGLLLAGLSYVHIFVCAAALVWCGAALVAWGPRPGRRALASLAAGLVAAALSAPWLALLAGQSLPGTGSSAMHVAGNPSYNAMPAALLWAGSNRLLLALAGCGAAIALLRGRAAGAALVGWAAAMLLLANPALLGLPYLSFITNELIAITMFAPIALLIGGGVAGLEAAALRGAGHARALWPALGVVALLGAGLWGAWESRTIVRPDTVLATAADRAAIDWVARELPADARFVVGTAPWLYDVDRGADGGWWLLPLAGRAVSTPPVVFNYGAPEYVAAVKAETAWLRSGAGADPGELAAFMGRHGYAFVYAAERPGSLSRPILRDAAQFEELYAVGDVGIFRLRGAAGWQP